MSITCQVNPCQPYLELLDSSEKQGQKSKELEVHMNACCC